MPEAVRTVGLWIGRLKRGLRETRSEIERQMGMDDIRRQLHNEDIMRSLEDARRDMDNVVAQTQASLTSVTEAVEREYHSEPDLPYHAHTEENAALEHMGDKETDSTLLPNLLASQIEQLDSQLETSEKETSAPHSEKKVQLDKRVTPEKLATLNPNPALHNKTASENKTTSDTKATL
jgi:sec-independent protein translocase protein TatB